MWHNLTHSFSDLLSLCCTLALSLSPVVSGHLFFSVFGLHAFCSCISVSFPLCVGIPAAAKNIVNLETKGDESSPFCVVMSQCLSTSLAILIHGCFIVFLCYLLIMLYRYTDSIGPLTAPEAQCYLTAFWVVSAGSPGGKSSTPYLHRLYERNHMSPFIAWDKVCIMVLGKLLSLSYLASPEASCCRCTAM